MAAARLEELKIATATADFEQPETPLEAVLRRPLRQEARRGSGVRSPSTTRTKRPGASTPGPAAATSLARRCSASRSRSSFDAGAEAGGLAWLQNHGGWNSDDHQNNLLGRIRISVHRRRTSRGRSAARARAQDSGDSGRRAHAGTSRHDVQLLAHDGARVEGSERPDRSLVAAVARGHDEPGAGQPRHGARNTTCSSAATSSSRATPVVGRRARSAARSARRRAADAAHAGPLAGRSQPARRRPA